jgi:hypothetical protein
MKRREFLSRSLAAIAVGPVVARAAPASSSRWIVGRTFTPADADELAALLARRPACVFHGCTFEVDVDVVGPTGVAFAHCRFRSTLTIRSGAIVEISEPCLFFMHGA